jgi:hypothetical protein
MSDSLPTQNPDSQNLRQRRRAGLKIFAGCIVVAGLIVCFVAVKDHKTGNAAPGANAVATAPVEPARETTVQTSAPPSVPTAPARAAVVSTAATTATNGVVARSARDLVNEMWEICGIHGPVTQEQAEKFKQHLEELIRGGAASVAAIREFLE